MFLSAPGCNSESASRVITYSFDTILINGLLTLTLSTTAASNIPAGRYVWNASLIHSDGSTMRIVEGNVDVLPAVI